MNGHMRGKLLEVWHNAYFPEESVKVYLEEDRTNLLYDYFINNVWVSRTIISKDLPEVEERWLHFEGYVKER